MEGHSKIEVVREDAERLLHDGRDAATELLRKVDPSERVRKYPIAMMLAGFGVGYLLGKMRTPSGRVARLGLRYGLLPLLELALAGRRVTNGSAPVQ